VRGGEGSVYGLWTKKERREREKRYGEREREEKEKEEKKEEYVHVWISKGRDT